MPFSSFDDEANWVKQIKEGDSDTFGSLFNKYCQSLINFSRRIVNDTETAENIIQDVFLKVWENRGRLDPNLSIKSYLYTIARNMSLKHQRHQTVVRDSEETVRGLHSSVKTPDEVLDESEMASSIRLAIDSLPEKCGIIFKMNRFDGLTYREISEILEISIKTVENQMSIALKKLKSYLTPYVELLLLLVFL